MQSCCYFHITVVKSHNCRENPRVCLETRQRLYVWGEHTIQLMPIMTTYLMIILFSPQWKLRSSHWGIPRFSPRMTIETSTPLRGRVECGVDKQTHIVPHYPSLSHMFLVFVVWNHPLFRVKFYDRCQWLPLFGSSPFRSSETDQMPWILRRWAAGSIASRWIERCHVLTRRVQPFKIPTV